MGYSTPSGIRTLLARDSAIAPDTELQPFCLFADKAVFKYITVLHRDEEMIGNINGTNKVFYVHHVPVADSDYDKDVDTADVKVFTWTDRDDPATKTQVTVSSVDAYTGRIELTFAPSTTVKKVTCTYYTYSISEMNYDLLTLACDQYAGYLYLQSQYIMEGDTTRIGAITKTYRRQLPFERLYDQFIKTLSLLRSPFRISKADKVFKHLHEY